MSRPHQQVNLYRPEAQPRRDLFGADTLILSAAAVLAGLLCIWGFGVWQIDHLQRAVDSLQSEQQQAQQALAALGAVGGAATAEGSDPANMQSRIDRLAGELAARQQALALLRSGAVGRTSGFSADLAALARHPVPGLWLRHVAISGASRSMSLAGEALAPDLVPRYLRDIAAEPALRGLRFAEISIERPALEQPRVPARQQAGHPGSTRGYRFRVEGAAAARLASVQAVQP